MVRFLICLKADTASFHKTRPGYFSSSLQEKLGDQQDPTVTASLSHEPRSAAIPAVQLSIVQASLLAAWQSSVLWHFASFWSSKGWCFFFFLFAMTFWPVVKASTPISLHWHAEKSDILTFTRDESKGDRTWIDGTVALNFPYKCKCQLNKDKASLFTYSMQVLSPHSVYLSYDSAEAWCSSAIVGIAF